MSIDDPNDLDLIVRGAWLYYGDGLTQAEVAERLFVSRQTVGRLLETARQHGIVRMEFDTHYLGALKLATRLRIQLAIQDAVVVPGARDGDVETVNERIATALAAYVRRFLKPGTTMAVGWGDTVLRSLKALSPESLDGVTLVTATGGVRAIQESLASNRELAQMHVVPAPLMVSSKRTAEIITAESAVREALELAASASVAITGIGSADPATSSSVRSGILTVDDVAACAKAGAVGDMLGEWFDIEGRSVAKELSERRVGLGLDQIRAMPNVIVAAGGVHKVDAIRGAAAGRLGKVLITDELTAEALLSAPDPWTLDTERRERIKSNE